MNDQPKKAASRPRIRTIKPELWDNNRVNAVHPVARLLFLYLMGTADDEGRRTFDHVLVRPHLEGPGFEVSQRDVFAYLAQLHQVGLVTAYTDEGHRTMVAINGWREHQYVAKPTPSLYRHPPEESGVGQDEFAKWLMEKFPKLKTPLRRMGCNDTEASWIPPDVSGVGQEHSGGQRPTGEGLNVRNRPGTDLEPTRPDQDHDLEPTTTKKPSTGVVVTTPRGARARPGVIGATTATWNAYAASYLDRYQTEPARNATVNGQLATLVQRLGENDAPHVAAFYVRQEDRHYIAQAHPVGLLVRDYQRLHTAWKTTGRVATIGEATQAEKRTGAVDRVETLVNQLANDAARGN